MSDDEPEIPDPVLVQRALTGSSSAFTGLFHCYYERERGFAYRIVLDHSSADDVAQSPSSALRKSSAPCAMTNPLRPGSSGWRRMQPRATCAPALPISGNSTPCLYSRRPAQHPFDEVSPCSLLQIFPGPQGKPMLLTEYPSMRDHEVLDLETGKRIAALQWNGIYQRSGDMPLHWEVRSGEITHTFAFDPTQEKPRLLFRNPGQYVAKEWDKVTPEFDCRKVECQGEVIAPVIHGGRLWLLKWDRPNGSLQYDPNLLRLVGFDLANRKCKRLKGMLARQKAFKKEGVSYIEPLVFVSHPGIVSHLSGNDDHVSHLRSASRPEWGVTNQRLRTLCLQ